MAHFSMTIITYATVVEYQINHKNDKYVTN